MTVEQTETFNQLVATIRWQIATLTTKFIETADFHYYARAAQYGRQLVRLTGLSR